METSRLKSGLIERNYHRRRIETEGKAKVIASVWGDRIFSIPCRASCFVSVNLKQTVELNRFFQKD